MLDNVRLISLEQFERVMRAIKDFLVRALVEPRDYIILRDRVTGYEHIIEVYDGVFAVSSLFNSMEIHKPPIRLSYSPGDAIDLTGIGITLKGSGITVEIDETNPYLRVEPPVAAMGITTVTVIYNDGNSELSDTFEIEVSEFDPEFILIDFYYITNDDGTYTITGWKGTLNGEPSTKIVVPDNDRIIL